MADEESRSLRSACASLRRRQLPPPRVMTGRERRWLDPDRGALKLFERRVDILVSRFLYPQLARVWNPYSWQLQRGRRRRRVLHAVHRVEVLAHGRQRPSVVVAPRCSWRSRRGRRCSRYPWPRRSARWPRAGWRRGRRLPSSRAPHRTRARCSRNAPARPPPAAPAPPTPSPARPTRPPAPAVDAARRGQPWPWLIFYIAVYPPSTSRSLPVMKAEASLAR